MAGRGSVPLWEEAAEDWLAAKRIGRRKDDPGHADRARRGDLRRWAAAINTVMDREPVEAGLSLTGWNSVMTEIGNPDVLLRALDLLGNELSTSSRQRMLSTLRGFCGYLARRGLIPADPTDIPELTVGATHDDDVRAFTDGDIDSLLAAAAIPPTGRARSGWPARDIAIIATLATCGLRVSELCAATDTTIDTHGDHPLLRLRAGVKGGRQRTVPIPSPTLAHIRHYQTERNRTLAGPGSRRLFVRHDGTALNQQFVDTLLRRCATTANIATPEGAMAHALRHSYGMRLALRGVPLPVIQQLLGHADPRTTTIYTTAHATDLTDTLTNAGLL